MIGQLYWPRAARAQPGTRLMQLQCVVRRLGDDCGEPGTYGL